MFSALLVSVMCSIGGPGLGLPLEPAENDGDQAQQDFVEERDGVGDEQVHDLDDFFENTLRRQPQHFALSEVPSLMRAMEVKSHDKKETKASTVTKFWKEGEETLTSLIPAAALPRF